jgi:hypothetical protein
MYSQRPTDYPPWVRWIAQDRNGAWWGFEHEPNEGAASWYENEVGRYQKLSEEGGNPNWRHTLKRVDEQERF